MKGRMLNLENVGAVHTHTHTHTHTQGSARERKAKTDKVSGITLVALVVTIVVLLILAGITIVYVFGDNGVFGQASQGKIETELAKIEEKASLIYSDKLLEKLQTDSNNKPTMQEIVEELKSTGNKIEEVALEGENITGISLDRESMTVGFGGTNKIKVTLERSETSTEYYAVVDGKYYKMHFNGGVITIDRKASDISNEGTEQVLNVSSSDETVATVTLDESTNSITVVAKNQVGTSTVTVTYGNYTKICEITVRDIPITTAMELNSIRARIAVGYTRWLTAITTPVDALQEFEWTSSDESIAIVDNKGVVTAKRDGTVTITAKAIDGSNKEGECEVIVVENALDVATLTDFQTTNTVAKDENGNLITVPGDFKVLVSEGTKVTQGIVIQDKEENEFVWVPVDSVSTGTKKPADDIRLGRYTFERIRDETTGLYEDGTPDLKQAAYTTERENNHTEIVTILDYYQELVDCSNNTPAKNLGDFVAKTKENGGYYLARYEASQGTDKKARSQRDKVPWVSITQPNAATQARNMYVNSYIESDLVNSYAWDTAIVFIQKYSQNSNYANQESVNTSKVNTGKVEDRMCNIHDMASNCREWSTEHCTGISISYYCTMRGGMYGYSNYHTAYHYSHTTTFSGDNLSFRVVLYFKKK